MIKPPFIRSPYNYDTKKASDEAVAWTEPGDSLTVQSQTEDADLNVIMKRFGVTGRMPEDARPVFYGDFDGIIDYRTAQDAIIAADRAFMDLPAQIRSKFGNDPQQFMEFCSKSTDGKTLDNLEEMRKLGLAIPAQPKGQENGPVETINRTTRTDGTAPSGATGSNPSTT